MAAKRASTARKLTPPKPARAPARCSLCDRALTPRLIGGPVPELCKDCNEIESEIKAARAERHARSAGT